MVPVNAQLTAEAQNFPINRRSSCLCDQPTRSCKKVHETSKVRFFFSCEYLKNNAWQITGAQHRGGPILVEFGVQVLKSWAVLIIFFGKYLRMFSGCSGLVSNVRVGGQNTCAKVKTRTQGTCSCPQFAHQLGYHRSCPRPQSIPCHHEGRAGTVMHPHVYVQEHFV